MTESSSQLLVALAKIGLAMKHAAWTITSPRGLNPTQAQVLAVLLPTKKGVRLGRIAEQLAITQPTASDAVAALERKGLVEKREAREDGRALSVVLTKKGRAEAEAVSGWPDYFANAVSDLTAEEQRVLTRALMRMIRALQVAGRIPVLRMCVTCRYFQPNIYDDETQPHHCAFVNAPFGDGQLRFDCGDHETSADMEVLWRLYTAVKE